MIKKAFFLLIPAIFCIHLYPRNKANLKQTFFEAEYFFMKGEYSDALPIYLRLYEDLPDNSNLAYHIGACYLNIPGKKDIAINYLVLAGRNLSALVKEGTKLIRFQHLTKLFLTLQKLTG